MQTPTMIGARDAAEDVVELSAFAPVPGAGALAVNAFVLKGREPVLVDTGLAAVGPAFLDTLAATVDPADLRWIWLSHTDADHVGNLPAVLARAPKAEVLVHGLGVAKMELLGLPLDRVRVIEPGAAIETADRRLVPLRPPYYDAPETLGFYDPAARLLFAGDSFGALLDAPAEEARALPRSALREGMAAWTAIDAPGLSEIAASRFAAVLKTIERLDPAVIISAHLPYARGATRVLLDTLRETYERAPADVWRGIDVERLFEAKPAA